MSTIRKTNRPARLRFDPRKLQDLAGDKVFARGEEYHRAKKVEILVNDATRILARVTGTEPYRAELHGQDRSISGRCSCRAFEDWGFCKHMVATGLAANAAAASNVPIEDPFGRIRAHLRAQGIDALVDLVAGLAEEDAALFDRLDIAAALSADKDDGKLGDRIRRALDRAIGTHYVDYGLAEAWSAGVDLVLDGIQDLVAKGRGELARELAAHAYEDLEGKLEAIDDSDGYLGGLMEKAATIHLAAATIEKPEPVAFARELYAREVDDEYGHFFKAWRNYADVLGPVGLAEYRRLALEAFGRLGPAKRGVYSSIRDRLEDILDGFAERENDVEARIALRTASLSSSFDYLRLAELCLANSRPIDALRWAEEGLWVFEDEAPDHRLVTFTVARLDEAARKEDAANLLWRAFEKRPSLDLYAAFRERAGPSATDRSLGFLRTCMTRPDASRFYGIGDLLVRILIQESRLEEAWAEAKPRNLPIGTLEKLARASEKAFPYLAIEVHSAHVARLIDHGGDANYREAVALVGHLATLRSAAEQDLYVTALRERYRRKRNLMKLLP